MTAPRDRVLAALRFEESDLCPYYIWIHERMASELSKYYGDEDFQETLIRNHSVMWEVPRLNLSREAETSTDLFGSVWQWDPDRLFAFPNRPLLSRPDLDGFIFPDVDSDATFAGMDEWLTRYADRFRLVQIGFMLFERTWALRGFENILVDLHEHPAFVEELLDRLEELCFDILERLITDYGDRIDAVGISDDCGGERGMLIDPAHWRRFLKPRHRRLYERIRKAGLPTYLHTCGDITPIIPDLIDIGLNMLQPIQPEAMDIFDLKRRYGRDLCLVGGVSTQRALSFGSAAEIRREVRSCIEGMAPGGGYIMAPAKSIMPGVPVENAAALIDAMVHQNDT